MVERRDAIVFIPGTFGLTQERDFCLNSIVIRGLTQNTTHVEVREIGKAEIEGCQGKRLEIRSGNETIKQVDLYEAYWLDLVKRLSAASLKERVLRGTDLLIYSVFSRMWKAVKEAPMMILGAAIALILLILWYYSTIAMALVAIGQDPTFFGSALPKPLADTLGDLGTAMGGWSLWATVSALLVFLPVDLVVDQTDLTKRYLQNQLDESTGEVLRIRIRKRVLETLMRVVECPDYEHVTILTHSFGTLIGTELLAESEYAFPKPVTYITAGGFLKLMSLRSARVQTLIQEALQKSAVQRWTDFYSRWDFVCTKTPVLPPVPDKFESYRVLNDASLWDALSNKTHAAYFTEKDVISTLLGL